MFFIETIDKVPKDEKLMHLKAVYFVRCTEENLQKISHQISEPAFSSYHLFFSSTVHNEQIKRLAEADVHNTVSQVQELFADFQVINSDLFTLDLQNSLNLGGSSISQQTQFNRVVEGIFGVCMATRAHPLIRYEQKSPICSRIADCLR